MKLVERLVESGDFLQASKKLPECENKNTADFYLFSGLINRGLQRYSDAEKDFREAIKLNSREPRFYTELGVLYYLIGDLKSAEFYFKEALFLNPQDCQANLNLGLLFRNLGDTKKAIEFLLQAEKNCSDNFLAKYNLAFIYYNLGETETAIKYAKASIKSNPQNAEANFLLGKIYQDKKLFERAKKYYQKAISYNSSVDKYFLNLGIVCHYLAEFDCAVEMLQKAVEINPENEDAKINLASVFSQIGRLEESEKLFREIIKKNPSDRLAKFNLSLLYLKLGKFVEGFSEYENRFSEAQKSVFPEIPFWKGENLSGKTIFVLDEQGIGDVIQFVRYLPFLREKGAKVILQTKKSLVSLFKKNNIADEIISDLPKSVKADFKIYLVSLPFVTQKYILEITEYIKPTKKISFPFEDDVKPKIAITWRGNPQNIFDKLRSFELKEFSKIFNTGALFYSFQIDATEDEKAFLKQLGIIDLSEKIKNFEDTANYLAKMDLVISVDTALAHIAGAMNIPVWIIIGEHDWRWGIDSEKTQWYNSARLIRFSKFGGKNKVLPYLKKEIINQGKKIYHQKILLLKYYGMMNLEEKRLDEAEKYFRKLLEFEIDYEILFYLGYVHFLKEKYDLAIELIEKSLEINNDFYEAHKIAGSIYLKKSDFENSAKHYEKIINQVNESDVLNNYGFVLYSLKRFDEAEKYFEKAISISQEAGYFLNAGNNFFEQNKFNKALEYYDKAIELDKNFSAAYQSKSLALLKTGNYKEGFRLFKWTLKEFDIPKSLGKKWNGESLSGKTIIVYTEQGLGDAIFFSRYLRFLKKENTTVNLVCNGSLVHLFEHSPYVDNVASNWFGFADFYISLSEIPAVLDLTDEEYCFMPDNLFLLDKEKINERKNSFPKDKLNVGLIWETYSQAPTAKPRSMSLDEIEHIFSLEDVSFYIIQKDTPTEIEEYLVKKYKNVTFVKIDFYELAHFIKALDVIFSIDSAVLNLAASVYANTYALINKFCDWRWGIDQKRSCFYPDVKVIRQKEYFTWKSEIKKVEKEIIKAKERKINTPEENLINEEDVLKKAEEYFTQNEFSNAINILENGLKKFHGSEAILFKLGYAFQITKNFDGAVFYYSKLLEKNPLHYDALNNLGVALRDLQQYSEAEKFLTIASKLNPNSPSSLNNLGLLYEIKGDFNKAISFYDEALRINPGFHNAMLNKANSLMFLYKFNEALELLNKILKDDPENVGANYNKGIILLFKKDYREGFKYYEWRRKRDDYLARSFSKPELNTKEVRGKKILIYDEQGYGDTLQFCRFVKLFKELGANTILQVHFSLASLLVNCPGVDKSIPRTTLGDPENIEYDYHIPLLSLPYFFGIENVSTFMKETSYLKADMELIKKYRNELFNSKKIKVGLVWEGKKPVYNEHRSMSLDKLQPFINAFDFEFYSLQQKNVAEQNRKLMNRLGVVDLSEHLYNFSQTAAIIENLDFVVTIDTSIAHLSGALGKKTYVLLSRKADWRWGTGEKTDWYKTHTLIRQKDLGNWEENVNVLINKINSFETDFN